jgi:cyclic-di-AMP phosphodiesterase PgpH
MDSSASPDRPSTERIAGIWYPIRLWFLFAAGIAASILLLSLPLSSRQTTVVLKAGEVSPQDILAPSARTYSSDVLTEQARQQAAEAVPEVYDPPDGRVARIQLQRLQTSLLYLDTVRADLNATRPQALSDLAALADVHLDLEMAQEILELPEARWQAVKAEAALLLEQVMRTEIRQGLVEQAQRTIPAMVSISMPESQARLTSTLAAAFVAPNAPLNLLETQNARAAARQSMSPVLKTYASGETIVSHGQVVSPLQIEGLMVYGLLRPPDPWRETAVRALLVIVLASVLALYLHRVHPDLIGSGRLATILVTGLVVMVAGIQSMIPGRAVLPYLFPAGTMPMVVTILYGPGAGVLTAVLSGSLAGFISGRGLEIALYILIAGTLAALMIGRAERLSAFLLAGLASSVGAAAVVVIFRFPDPTTDLVGKATLLGAALLNGLLAASIAFGLVLLAGNLLGIATNLTLLELSRPDHPLLQYILRRAPGTYQHSLQVANLAEQAARSIGANAMLARVGALYHDAGKAIRPQYFIENQVPGQNIHEQMEPDSSAGVILAHVKDGLELARKYRLPRRIQSFIPEHHGTLEASYQYRAALEAAGGDESRVDRSKFAYPGPRPRSREAAILMLADGVEAKARAENPKDEDAIEALVKWVIEDRRSRGQLDRTDLTLRELELLRRSFLATLRGIYHPRLRYPCTPNGGNGETAA